MTFADGDVVGESYSLSSFDVEMDRTHCPWVARATLKTDEEVSSPPSLMQQRSCNKEIETPRLSRREKQFHQGPRDENVVSAFIEYNTPDIDSLYMHASQDFDDGQTDASRDSLQLPTCPWVDYSESAINEEKESVVFDGGLNSPTPHKRTQTSYCEDSVSKKFSALFERKSKNESKSRFRGFWCERRSIKRDNSCIENASIHVLSSSSPPLRNHEPKIIELSSDDSDVTEAENQDVNKKQHKRLDKVAIRAETPPKASGLKKKRKTARQLPLDAFVSGEKRM